MRKELYLKSISFLFVVFIGAAGLGGSPVAEKYIKDIVDDYRKIILLFSDECDLSGNDGGTAYLAGKMLFYRKQENLRSFQGLLEADIDKVEARASTDGLTERFLERLERGPLLWDADKLAFRELLDSLSYHLELRDRPTRRQNRLKNRIDEDIKGLRAIQEKYDAEISRILERFDSRGIELKRQSWDEYIDFLKANYNRGDIISEFSGLESMLPAFRGEAARKEDHEIFGYSLPEKTVMLTFDDGPHPRYTEKILAELDRNGLKAVFFQVGNLLGHFEDPEDPKLSKYAEISKQIKKSGSVLANHTYSHPVLPKLKDREVKVELERTNRLIHSVSGKEPGLFRPPYGARNSSVLSQIKAKKLKSVMWNIDSRDWADPVPRSVARRVVEGAEKQKRGIILFHDIQSRTVATLPLVIAALEKRGFRFASWNGTGFHVDGTPDKQKGSLYRESWAVIIGIDEYAHWPKLKFAVNDARAVREKLIDAFSFKEENIFTLYNGEATLRNILSLFHDKLGSTKSLGENDRVLVFYAGHGTTRKLPSGRDIGYIIPVDADKDHYFGQSISMTHIGEIAEAVPAKHLFFVMDSCYSGLALVRGGSPVSSENFIEENSRRMARQMLTAGGADQEVSDSGPGGHSVFTWTLLQSLDGPGDLNSDGYITASELATYLSPVVSSISLQTPAFGNLPGSEGGDFVFSLHSDSNFLSEFSRQLDEDELKLASEIDRLKDEVEKRRRDNQELKTELAEIKRQLRQLKQGTGQKSIETGGITPTELNAMGLKLYREKKYDGALEIFKAAAEKDGTYVEAVNNAGFVSYRTENYAEALVWLKKAVELTPHRSVAWLNLGDTYYMLKKYDLAQDAYEKHLLLDPDSRALDSIKEKLDRIEASRSKKQEAAATGNHE